VEAAVKVTVKVLEVAQTGPPRVVAAGVTLELTPEGMPAISSQAGLENPLRGVTVMTVVAFPPGGKARESGDADRL
jgi:hypothetical protein